MKQTYPLLSRHDGDEEFDVRHRVEGTKWGRLRRRCCSIDEHITTLKILWCAIACIAGFVPPPLALPLLVLDQEIFHPFPRCRRPHPVPDPRLLRRNPLHRNPLHRNPLRRTLLLSEHPHHAPHPKHLAGAVPRSGDLCAIPCARANHACWRVLVAACGVAGEWAESEGARRLAGRVGCRVGGESGTSAVGGGRIPPRGGGEERAADPVD
jgi:hypothetical protein